MKPSGGRVALVTGAASGIGRACVHRLLDDHDAVVGIDAAAGDQDWPEPDRVRLLQGDVADAEATQHAVDVALESYGRLDSVVLNAGIAGRGSLEGMDLDRARRIHEIDLWGVVHGLRASAPALKASGAGSVVVTASVSGLGADPDHWAYNSAKGAVVNLVRAAAWDLASAGVRVNAVAPGPIHTPLTARLARDDPDRYEGLRQSIPLGRWGTAEEVAAVICFLASPAASFVTGVTVPVDGGITAGSGMFRPAAVPAAPPESDGR